MCGIAGALDWTGRADARAVDAMVLGIAHRGPDDRGLWSSRNGVCVLGHARLSIVDLSPAGHQPMIEPGSGNAIVFNGDVMNTAARLEELSRDVDGGFLASQAAMARFGSPPPFAVREIGRVPIRGRTDGIDVVGLGASAPCVWAGPLEAPPR